MYPTETLMSGQNPTSSPVNLEHSAPLATRLNTFWQFCTCGVQYMVVYEAVVAEAQMTAFFVDGSSLSNMQVCCTLVSTNFVKLSYTHSVRFCLAGAIRKECLHDSVASAHLICSIAESNL